jgi:hypothetical protein
VTHQEPGSGRLPYNFSWLNDELAGSGHPGRHPHELQAALAALKDEGVGCIVSLDPVDGDAVTAAGLTSIQLPVPDMGIPSLEELSGSIAAALARLRGGRKVLVHCGAGYGRTGLFLACLLVSEGMAPDEAIDFVRRKRPGSIETPGQEALIRAWGEYARRVDPPGA